MFRRIIVIVMLTVIGISAKAQFYRGFGVFVGPNTSRHEYANTNPQNGTFPGGDYPPSHRSAELPRFAVGIFAEFLRHRHVRWQTEFEYTMKGAVERELVNMAGDRRGAQTNRYTYVQWNNYLKFITSGSRFGYLYFMLGAKLEFNQTRRTPAYSYYSNDVRDIMLSPDGGIGYEFETFSTMNFFTELHYNPDVLNQYNKNGVTIKNRTWELRVGVIFRPMRTFDDCNAPRYHGNY